jgi:hypothetical protein
MAQANGACSVRSPVVIHLQSPVAHRSNLTVLNVNSKSEMSAKRKTVAFLDGGAD